MSRRKGLVESAALAAEAAAVWLRDGVIQPLRSKPPHPRALLFISTHRCNARCVMCGIWKETGTREHELSPDDLDELLADELFSGLEFVSINGGEPFVRDDLAELCRVILRRCPKVKRLSLTTNGLLHRRMRDVLPRISDAVEEAGALLDVSVSVHGMEKTLDTIYGVENAFTRSRRTVGLLEELREKGRLSFSMNCVLLAGNLDEARALRSWAAARAIPITFVIGERRRRFRTEGMDEAFVTEDDEARLVSFLRQLVDDPEQSAVSADKYREIVDIMEGAKTRTLSCYYAMGGVLLGYDGVLYYCPHSAAIGDCRERPPAEIYFDPENLAYRRTALFESECLECPPYTRTRWEMQKDLPRTLRSMVRRRRSGVGDRT